MKYREIQSLIPKKLKYILEIQYLKYKLTIRSDTFKVCLMNLGRIDSKEFQKKKRKK